MKHVILSALLLSVGHVYAEDEAQSVTTTAATTSSEIGDNLTISPSYSVMRSKTSSTPKTSTVTFNISLSF